MTSLLQGTYKLPKKAFSPAVFPYVKVFLFVLVSLYLLLCLRESRLANIWSIIQIKVIISPEKLLVPFLLVFVNYSLEAKKWQLVVTRLQSFSFTQAVSGVLAGMTASFITPGGIGDYFARVLHADPGKREMLPASLLVVRTCQMFITIALGLLSLIILTFSVNFFPGQLYFIWISSSVAFAILFLLLLKRVYLINRILVTRIGNFIGKFIHVTREFTNREILHILILSLFRHLVYLIQLFLLFYVFDVQAGFSLLLLAGNFIFLCKSFLPVFFELGAREYGAVLFFSFFSVPVEPAIVSCLVLWAFNIVLPALAGLPFLLFLKPISR